MQSKDNYGWICPKCGCPNAPTNQTCVACFSSDPQKDCVGDKIVATRSPLFPPSCSKCGIKFYASMGYVCVDDNCPCGMGPGIAAFNPLNAKDNK